ncbi:agamous-like MADS-box protein AGL29 [Phoenix dactylifera]|uniref:Agamous-like MADS-box protein AGL29 n=1 Tax=Phoenix dactylifera TaxID=42345 RepID=A0A8B8ZRF0_PHODC|nr:agamous-like MADS-box protein AGL29 [Phoenix dactylifera]
MGRQKIPIEIIDKNTARDICFSKRRKGLFSKAKKLARAGSEIAILIFSKVGSGIAILIFSKVGNVFSFSHPTIQSIADRFLSVENSKDGSSDNDKFHGNADIVARGSDAASGGLTRSSGEGESSTKGDELDGGDAIRQDKALESDDEEDELEREASSEAEMLDITGSSQVEHAAMQDAEHATGGESATEEETLHSG